ncbi:MAG: putative DNA binding domain-containing protein [Candidatus Methanomethylophilus sp.]|nr:putative DNA binding domain-containing protein [Methanomethylophilus sp.]
MELGTESGTVEFKKDIRQLDKGLISLTAMVNRYNRGTVYFGVDDSGNVVGMTIGKSLFEKIRITARNNILPRMELDIVEHVTPEGPSYIAVSAIGFEIPYSYGGRYYVRNYSTDEQATPDVVARMVLSRGIDAMKETVSPDQELTFNSLGEMMVAHGMHPRRDRGFHDTIGLLTREGEYNMGAYLLADRNNVNLHVIEYAGTSRDARSRASDYGGRCLFAAMRDVYRSVADRNEIATDTDLGVGLGVMLYDTAAFKEAWFNACIHNSWRTGIPPYVLIFDDRIEIHSVGSIPCGLPQDDFYGGRSLPVNESFYNLASQLGFVEHAGRGIQHIAEIYGRKSVRLSSGGMTVTVPFAFVPSWVSERVWGGEHAAVTDRESAILGYLSENREAKLPEIAEEVGMNLSAVKRAVVNLKAKGLLQNAGTNRNSIWVVSSGYGTE